MTPPTTPTSHGNVPQQSETQLALLVDPFIDRFISGITANSAVLQMTRELVVLMVGAAYKQGMIDGIRSIRGQQ